LYLYLASPDPASFILSQEINALDSFSVLACTNPSLFSMNLSVPIQTGCKVNHFFFSGKFFLRFFLKYSINLLS
jgi:hypothetical protein